MKFLRLLLLAACASLSAATLEWEAAPAVEQIHRYRVWQRVGTNAWENIGTVTNATTFILPSPTNRVSFAITSVRADGLESELSDPLELAPPSKPGPLRLRLTLQSADSPAGPWSTLTNMVAEFDVTESNQRFFKNSLTRLP